MAILIKNENDLSMSNTSLTEENIDKILTEKLNEIHCNDISFSGFQVIEENNIHNTDILSEIEQIWERLNKTVSLVHNCSNCGAKLDIEENHPIFHCKYCGSTYIIGSVQPNSTY